MLIDSNMVFSGFVSKIINDCGDILKKQIKDADKNRKVYCQNIETRIYQVTIDALNEFTKDKYKGREVLYDSAENILKGFKIWKENYIEAVRSGLKLLVSQVTSDICEDFLRTLQYVICKNEDDVLYKEITLLQHGKMAENMHEGFKLSHQNEEMLLEKMDHVIDKVDGKSVQVAEDHATFYPKNRAEEYAQKWDKNMFLNNFNKRDEHRGVNIKLRELYLDEHLPHYRWEKNNTIDSDIDKLLREYIVDFEDKKMLLILGQAGIGKSTLITWIMANIPEKKDDYLVYQFASDLKNVDWQGNCLLDEIFTTLQLKRTELRGKVLILDGFDEIDTKSDRKGILNKLHQKLNSMNYLETFSLIITCRENYIDNLRDIRCDYITLQAWDEEQIKSFCDIYGKRSGWWKTDEIKVTMFGMVLDMMLEDKEIFGIPLILYMVLAVNISIKKSSSVVDVYDQIFSIDGGKIYERSYDAEHRINQSEIKKHIYTISQKIAFWIFENNSQKAFISRDKFKEICANESEKIQSDVLIGNYFKLIRHCEGVGTDELQFVHRSIYEYFVAVYFFESIHNLRTKEEVAGKLGELLKDGCLSREMLRNIKYKFDSIKGYNLPELIKDIFNLMLRDGMTYYTKERYRNIVDREMNIFYYMLDIVHVWNLKLQKSDNNIVSYILHNKKLCLDLMGADLSGAGLSGADLKVATIAYADLSGADLRLADLRYASLYQADLSGADLSYANLSGAKLSKAKLSKANLSEADLSEADLRLAKLSKVNLSEAKLRKTIFDESQVKQLCITCDLSDSMVFISETEEIISYKRYAQKKKINI